MLPRRASRSSRPASPTPRYRSRVTRLALGNRRRRQPSGTTTGSSALRSEAEPVSRWAVLTLNRPAPKRKRSKDARPLPQLADPSIWARETIGSLAVAGSFYRNVPGVTFVDVDLMLQNLEGAHSEAVYGPLLHSKPTPVRPYMSRAAVSLVAELASDPRNAARSLLDRFLVSFLGDGTDVVRTSRAPNDSKRNAPGLPYGLRKDHREQESRTDGARAGDATR